MGLTSLKTPELSCSWFHHPLTGAGECQGFPFPSALLPLGEGSPSPSREQSGLLPEREHLREAWPWKCCSQGCFIPWHQVITGGTHAPSIRVDIRKDGGTCVCARVVKGRGQYAVRRLSRCVKVWGNGRVGRARMGLGEVAAG